MFHRETTDIQSRFGVSLTQVLKQIEELDPYLGDHNSLLDSETFCTYPEDLLCCNPAAVKVLQQHPEYLNAQSHRYFDMNDTHEGLILLRNMSHDNHFARMTFEHNLSFSSIPTIDTFLTPDVRLPNSMRYFLYRNPRALSFLWKGWEADQTAETWFHRSKWESLSTNPGAIDFLKAHPEDIHYGYLSKNPHPEAIVLLRQRPHDIHWEYLSGNPGDAALDLLMEQPERICFTTLGRNTNPRAVSLLRQHPTYINWHWMSSNACDEAVDLLLEHPDKIQWKALWLRARTPRQFELIRANLHQGEWEALCQNPSPLAVDLLAEHPHQIRWWHTLKYQPVFETVATYDYAGIREARRGLHEEFHAWACHPDMVDKWKDWELSDLFFNNEE